MAINDDNPLDFSSFGTPVDDGATPFDNFATPQPAAAKPRSTYGFNPDIESAIDDAAGTHGVDPDLMRTFARIESGGDPRKRTGSYNGLFMLSADEFKRFGGDADIFDPGANARAAALKFKSEEADFEKNYGRKPSASELYFLHQQGVGGADAHWRNPEAPAWENMYRTAEGRQKGPAWAKQAIWGNLPDSEKRRFGSVENITSRDFTDFWDRRVRDLSGQNQPVQVAQAPRQTMTDALDFSQFGTPVGEKPLDFTQQAVKPESDDRWEISKGFVGGFIGGNPKNFGDALVGFGHVFERPELLSRGDDIAKWGKDKLENYKARIPSFTDIRTDGVLNFLSDLGSYAGYQTGQAVASSLPSLATGAILGGTLRNPTAARVGWWAGASVPSFIQNYGDVYGSVREDEGIQKRIKAGEITEREAATWSMMAGGAMAALDTWGLEKVLGGAFKEAKADLKRRILAGMVKGAATEGPTEAMQEVISQWAQFWLGSEKTLKQAAIEVVDNFFGGIFGGGAIGGATSAIKKPAAKAEPAPDGGRVELDAAKGKVSPSAPRTTPPPLPEEGPEMSLPDVPGKPATETPPPSPEEMSVLRRMGYTEVDIRDMEPEQRAAEMEDAKSRGIVPDAPTAEPIADIVAQARDLADPENDRRGLYLSPDNVRQIQENPDFIEQIGAALRNQGELVQNVDGNGGILLTKDAATADAVRTAIQGGQDLQQVLGEVTGAGQGKPADATAVVQQVTPEGAVTRESAVTQDQVAPTLDAFKADGRDVRAVTPEEAIARREQGRATPPPLPTEQVGDGSRQAPVRVETSDDVARAEQRVAEPTDGQKEAGNYSKGHLKFQGLDITIENPKGSIRRGTSPDGTPWEVAMPTTYGYLKRSVGRDGDQVDVYVGPNPKSDRVFIIDQVDPDTGKFDEHKAMIGYNTISAARFDYEQAFSDGRAAERMGGVTEMTVAKFKDWLAKGKRTRPVSKLDEKPDAVAAQPTETSAEQADKLPDNLTDAERETLVKAWRYVNAIEQARAQGRDIQQQRLDIANELDADLASYGIEFDSFPDERSLREYLGGSRGTDQAGNAVTEAPQAAKAEATVAEGSGRPGSPQTEVVQREPADRGREGDGAGQRADQQPGGVVDNRKRYEFLRDELDDAEAKIAAGTAALDAAEKSINSTSLTESEYDSLLESLAPATDAAILTEFIETIPEIVRESIDLVRREAPQDVRKVVEPIYREIGSRSKKVVGELRQLKERVDQFLEQIEVPDEEDVVGQPDYSAETKAAEVERPKRYEGDNLTDDDIDTIVDQWKYVREVANRPKPESLAAFVIARGGIKDDAREVRHIAGAAKERPGLVNKDGWTLDDIALSAWEAGFMGDMNERPTIADFLDRLQDDLHTGTVVRLNDEPLLDDIRIANEIARELADYGVTTNRFRSEATLREYFGQERPATARQAARDEEAEPAAEERTGQARPDQDEVILPPDEAPETGPSDSRPMSRDAFIEALTAGVNDRGNEVIAPNGTTYRIDFKPTRGTYVVVSKEPESNGIAFTKGPGGPGEKWSRPYAAGIAADEAGLTKETGITTEKSGQTSLVPEPTTKEKIAAEAKKKGDRGKANADLDAGELFNPDAGKQTDLVDMAKAEPASKAGWKEGNRDPDLVMKLDDDGEVIGSVMFDRERQKRNSQEAWAALDADGNVIGYAPTLGAAKDIVDGKAEKADPYATGKDVARDHVLTNGRKTGTEYGMVVMADGSTKPVTPSERNSKSYLEVSAKTAPDLYDGPAKSADLHHNHPKSSSFSRADYTEAAVRPALRRTWVHGHDGSEYWASFKTNDPVILGKAYDIAMAVTERLTEKGYDLPRYRTHMIATMMRDGGVIEYGATLTPARADERIATLREKFGEDAIAKAVEDIRNLLGGQDVYDRRPGSARSDRDVGSASARVDEARPEAPGSEAVGERGQAQDRGDEGGQVEPQFQAEAELESLIDDVITKQFARKGKETTGPLKIGSGDILRSQSGREMSPAPNIDATTSGRATNSIKRMNAWLHSEAIKEIDARPAGRRDILGNDAEKAQLRTVLDGIDPKKATQSDQDTLNDIVFGSPEGATEANLVRRRGEKPSARKAAKAAGSAARNVIKGMDEVATGLATLFGAKSNRVGSGPSFDEDTYRKAVPFFKSGISHFAKAGADIKTAVRELVSYLADTAGMSKDTILDMKPYLVRFVRDIQTGVIDPAKGDENAPDSRQGVERDRGTGRSEDSLGQARVPDERIPDGSGAQPRDGKAGKDTAPARGGSVPDGDAAAVGTGRDRGVSGRAPRDERGPAGSDRGGRGSDAGVEGVPAGRVAAEAVSGTARRAPSLKEALAAQKEADAKVPFELNDPDNIRAALPALKPAQQDDVVKAEARFSQPEGHGFLLTNGTGTGKTWSGLGVVKRFVKQGKSNILIVAPSQGILDGWIDTGRMLGVDITRLPDTKTAGKGIVATTYANLGDNETLADRNWDLIVADEAHKLSQNEAGSPTDALHVLRGLTNKDPYGRARMKLAPELAKLKELEAAAKANQSLRKKYEEANTAYFQKVSDLRDELAKEPRAKALFLSATPFAYRKSTDYAEGFLFDYPELTGRYNSPGGQAEFLQRNFGYAIRYNRAEEPGPEVNVGVLEREFYERLKREGVLSGRRLEVEADYDRRFVLVDDAVGAKIDQAMNWLSSEKQGRYLPLFENILETFNYLAQRRLLEAIKAKHVVPRIKRDLELGRKVVVFHDYNEGGGFAPFAPPSNPNERVRPAYGEKEGPTIGELYSEFIKANPYVKTLDFAQFKSPIETLTTAFPEALVYNGRIPNKQRSRARDEFNLDGSGRDIIIVQSAAGEAGISLHDTTGKHQRVLYNLGLPTRPTTAIQQEGRIYREGQVSDAILRYMSTGTGWERTAFSQTIAERASTAENLALGDEARALRDAFIDSFNDADDIPQGADEGRGGKAKDRTMAGTVSPYEKAKAFYFAEGKKRGRRDQREGTDYYATPEPIGMKMVEFADVQIGERILEPSAGHGAIARWFPEGANRVLIEPSSNLASRAGLASPGAKVITSRFEDHYIGNKYDAIVMNPPFGAGGKDALDHVQKAVGHLREGGRVVAILPRGPAADKRLEAFRDSDANKNIYAALEIDLPPVMFERAGTKVATRLVVFERHSDPSTAPQTAYRDLSDAETINELFDRMENLSLSARRRENQSPAGQVPADVVEPPRKPVAPATAEVSFKLGETKHSRTGADLYVASIAKQVPRTTFDNLLATAKKHKGYYSSFRGSGAIPGFQFPDEESRTAFLQAINGGMREEADQEDFPRVNKEGYILALPYEKEWGNPRFIKADRERAIARLREIQSINADDAPWADLVQAKRDIDQIVTNLFYFSPDRVSAWETSDSKSSNDIWLYLHELENPEVFAADRDNQQLRRSLFSEKNIPAELADFADEGGQAIDSLLDSKRKGLSDLLKYDDEVNPVKPKTEKPVGALGDKMPSGFYFKAARKIDEARDTLFQMSGQAVINWLMKEGVSRAEINHFRLWDKFGGTAKFTREQFKQAIGERMFDFRRKMSWLNPERSKRDYDLGGTRAFTGPRVPGQGIYFERPIAFPQKLAGGAQFPPGQFESPHWYSVLKNAWASWRGSIREVPGYGKMLVGEEGQSDYMQGASTGRRPKITEQEFLASKEARPKYKKVMGQAEDFLLRAIGSGSMADRGTPIWDLRVMLGNDLVPTDNGNELSRPAWDKVIELARKYVKEHRQLYLGESYAALDKLVALRTRFEEFFAPGARDKYDVDLSKRTPQSPIDENYVRVMARDLLLLAAEKNVDSISVSTSSTTARIQNNPRAAHFYDQQMKPALERELRKLTGQWDLSLQKVALPKAMGSPKSERPYTVWAAKLEPATLEKIKQEGVSVFSIADLPRPKVSRLDYVKGRLLLRQPVDLADDAKPIFDMMRSEPSILPGMIPEAVITKLTPKKGTDKYIVTARDQYGEEHTFEDDAKKITRTQGQYLVANGRPLVVLTPLDFGGDFVQTVRTVRAHEAIHALRIAGFLPGGNRDAGTTWGRLVGHADLLGVLHMSRADFYKRLGDPRAATASKDVSTFEVYTTLYGHLNTGLALELYHQEAVAHMMEVYVAGGWTNQEIAPVKAILDDILSGKTAQWTDVREMPLSAGMLRSIADNEDGALGTDRVYSLQDTITGQSMRRDLDSLGFYSKALEAAKALKQEKGTPEQMLAQLKKAGVKDAEIEATGLADLFKEKAGSTTALESDAITLSQNPQQDGFDTKTIWYRGDKREWEGVDSDEANPDFPRAMYLTTDPALASYFTHGAEGSRVGKFHLRDRNLFDFRKPEHVEPLIEHINAKGRSIYPGFLGGMSMITDGARNGDWGILELDQVQQWLKDKGFTGWYAQEGPGKKLTVAVFDESDVRPAIPQQQGDRTASPPRRARLNQITKADIVKYLEENRVGLREVVSSINGSTAINRRMELERERAEVFNRWPRNRARLDAIFNELADLDMAEVRPTKWHSHSLDPSNPTYRETVLHLPGSEKDAMIARLEAKYGPHYQKQMTPDERATLDAASGEERMFRSGHFPEPNIIGHMMTSMVRHWPTATPEQIVDIEKRISQAIVERDAGTMAPWRRPIFARDAGAITADEAAAFARAKRHSMDGHKAKDVYLIDQIQSDWGQKLRDGGVRDEAKIAELKAKIEAKRREADAKAAPGRELLIANDIVNDAERAVPSAPWERIMDWLGYAKRVPGANELSLELLRLRDDIVLLNAELKTAEASSPGHPLVNTTDQWTQTTLRRAIRQAVEAGAEYIAIPTGNTVLSYNPGDEDGMAGFYGDFLDPKEVGIVPKNLRNLLQKIDKSTPPPTRVEKLETPSGMKGEGFTLFPLTEKVKTSVLEDGQPMFSMVPSAKSAVPANVKNISRDITEAISIITRITGRDAVQVEFRDQIAGTAANPAQLAASRSAGFDTRTAGGLYKRPTLDAKALIALATNDPAYDLRTAAGHEAFHHVEEVLANPAEKRLLTSDSEMTRMRALASDEFGMSPSDPRLSRLPATEIRAVAFQRYRRMREEGLANASRLHIGIRRLFDRMIQIFQGVRNVLKGYGYDSYEAIFDRARTGEMADPVARRASDRPVRTLRNLIDPQMRPEGYVEREPFDLKNVRLVGRAMASVPLDAIRTIQKSVSIASVRAKLGLPESDDGRPVSVFKYGNTYYVNDGNHRIEAMRINGAKTIRAEIIEIAPKDGDVEVLADRGPADVQAQPVGAQETDQDTLAALQQEGFDTSEPMFNGWWGETTDEVGVDEAHAVPGYWFTPSQPEAEIYQEVARLQDDANPTGKPILHKAYIRQGKQFVADKHVKSKLDKNGNLEFSRPYFDTILIAAKKYGYDSVRFKNVIDMSPIPHDQVVVFDKANFRVVQTSVGAQEDNQGAQAGLSDSDVQASLIPAVAKVYTARWLRRLQPHTDRIRVYLQDKVLPIRRQEEAIEAASGIKLPEHLSVYTAEAIYHGRAGERLTDLQEKYVEPLTQHLRKSNISFDELGDYLYARHAIERNEAIRQIDPTNDAGSGMTDAEANGIVGMIEQGSRAQGFKTAAGMIDAMIKDARDTLYRAGNLTKEQYDNWTTKYKSYVPLRGFEGEVEEFGIPRVGRGMDIRGPESMQALGRRSKADNPATYVIQQSVQAIIRSEKNRVDKTLYRLIQAHPNPDVWRVFKGEAKRRINPQTGLVEMYWVPPAFAARNKDNVFGVKIAGKQHYMEILHEPLARSLRTAQPGLLGTAPGRAFYSLARFYAQLVTSFNPEFVISNYLRDIQTALMNVGDVANAPPDVRKRIRNEALSFKSIRGVMAALQSHEGRTIFGGQRAADENMLGRKRSKEAQDYAKWFEEYRLAGGKISFIEMNDIDRIKKRVEHSIKEGKTMRAFRNVFDLIDNANSAVENGVRLSAYIALRKNGVSQDKAAFAARELTVNFNRKGELGPGINAFYLFFNASVQGTTRLAQALTRSPAVRKGAATIILAGVLIDLLNYSIAGNDDDDENAYEKIDDWKKEKNMIVMLPGRKDYVQIPMPYGYNVFYLFGQKMAALSRTSAGYGKEKSAKAIAGLLGAMMESFSPMGAAPSWLQMASPTLADPFVQIAENKSWFGGKIQPEKYNKFKPDSENFFSTAPAWAVDLARALNKMTGGSTVKSGSIDVSPESIEHISDFLGGGVSKFIGNIWNTGQRAMNGQEWIPEKTPFVRRLYGKSTGESRRRDFYEQWNEVDGIHYQFDTLRKAQNREGMAEIRKENPAELQAYEMMRTTQRQLSALRKQADAINLNRDLDAVEKEKRLKIITERENEIILKALKTYARLKKEQQNKP